MNKGMRNSGFEGPELDLQRHCKIATATIIRKSILYHTNWWKLQKWANSL